MHLHIQTLRALLLINGQFTLEQGRDKTSLCLQFNMLNMLSIQKMRTHTCAREYTHISRSPETEMA